MQITYAIVANNRWEGFLTETKTSTRALFSSNSILRRNNYYFRVSKDAANSKQTESSRILMLVY